MPKLLPAGFADVCIAYLRTGDTDEMCVTFGVGVSASSDPFAVASSIALDWVFAFPTGIFNNEVHGSRVTVRLSQEPDPPLVGEASLVHVGTASGDLVPQNSATIMRKQSAFGGRRGRGRMFLPWVLEGNVSNTGVIGSVTTAAYNGYGIALLTALNGTAHGPISTPMVILHQDGGPSTPGPSAVTSLTIDPVIGTQRRRLRR